MDNSPIFRDQKNGIDMKHKRIDANQNEVVKALREVGCSVLIISDLGNSADLIVGIRGFNFIIEVKDGRKPKSQRKLTKAEQKFHNEWRGQVGIVYSPTDAIDFIFERLNDHNVPYGT